MKNLLLAMLLTLGALPVAAEPFGYVSFQEIKAAGVQAEVAAAKRLMILLSLFLGEEDQTGYDIKDQDVRLIFIQDDITTDLARRLPYLKELTSKGMMTIPSAQNLQRFLETREVFCAALLSIAKQDPSQAALPTMAVWGRDTWVKTDPAINQHSEPILSRVRYEALRLKPAR